MNIDKFKERMLTRNGYKHIAGIKGFRKGAKIIEDSKVKEISSNLLYNLIQYNDGKIDKSQYDEAVKKESSRVNKSIDAFRYIG